MLAYNMWVHDHEKSNFPWFTAWWSDGTSPGPMNTKPPPVLVPKTPKFIQFGLQDNSWVQFWWISNELSSAKVLVCPSDKEKLVASDFSLSANGGFLNGRYRNNAASYWINLDSGIAETDGPSEFGNMKISWELVQHQIVLGDRHITDERVTAGSNCGSGIHYNGILRVNNPRFKAKWIEHAKYGHGAGVGNLASADGAVQALTGSAVQETLDRTKTWTTTGGIHMLVPR
jgi:hypothetical protein